MLGSGFAGQRRLCCTAGIKHAEGRCGQLKSRQGSNVCLWTQLWLYFCQTAVSFSKYSTGAVLGSVWYVSTSEAAFQSNMRLIVGRLSRGNKHAQGVCASWATERHRIVKQVDGNSSLAAACSAPSGTPLKEQVACIIMPDYCRSAKPGRGTAELAQHISWALRRLRAVPGAADVACLCCYC